MGIEGDRGGEREGWEWRTGRGGCYCWVVEFDLFVESGSIEWAEEHVGSLKIRRLIIF